MRYPDKKQAQESLDYSKQAVNNQFHDLHPTDRATAYRDLETWAGYIAAKQEEANERDGVPERGQDG